MARIGDFTGATQRAALQRQGYRCGSCGVTILQLGSAERDKHEYGEGAQAHHMLPLKSGRIDDSINNCVVLCQSCHYTAHEGGSYRYGTVVATEHDFPYFYARSSGK